MITNSPHLVYKISSNFSNEFYIGRNTVKNLKQFNNYWSSSKKWKQFVLDNGKDNFTKEILFEFDNEQEQVDKENYFNLELYRDDPDCWSRRTNSVMICEAARKICKERIENGSHPFLDGEMARRNAKRRITNKTHNFFNRESLNESTRQRIAAGTHHFQGENNPSRKRVANGTHHFLGGEIQKDAQRKMVADGIHHFLNGEISKATTKKRIEAGTHNFLGENNPSRKRVANGTHHLLGPESNRKRIEDGTHHFLKIKGTIWVCNSERSTRINPNELNDYISKGYQKGRKFKLSSLDRNSINSL
jgi:hypothetical protein